MMKDILAGILYLAIVISPAILATFHAGRVDG